LIIIKIKKRVGFSLIWQLPLQAEGTYYVGRYEGGVFLQSSAFFRIKWYEHGGSQKGIIEFKRIPFQRKY